MILRELVVSIPSPTLDERSRFAHAERRRQDFLLRTMTDASATLQGECYVESAEGERIKVKQSVIALSNIAKEMLAEAPDDDDELPVIPIPNVKVDILRKILEFCEYHESTPMVEIEKPLKSVNMQQVVGPWDATFVEIEQSMLFDLILAANFMDIKPLLDLTCAKVASMIKGKQPEEIRKTFNIEKDFTEEEEKQIKEENRWCEESA